MAVKKFGYARVSTKDQNLARQIEILKAEGIEERDIFVEKESGRSFERKVYRSLVDTVLREGDLLVVTELKRFGRNYREIYQEWHHITKEIGADIKVTSMPILDTTQSKELVGQLITDVVLWCWLFLLMWLMKTGRSAMSCRDRGLRWQRQKAGILADRRYSSLKTGMNGIPSGRQEK